MATTVARLEAVLSAQTRDFDRAMGRSESRINRVGRAAKVGLAIGVGVGIAVLRSSVKAAIEAEKSQARLEQAFKGAGVAIGPYRAAIERASTAAINLGFDDEDLKDSIGSLIIATGDYKKAQDASNVAMDLARFKGIGLEDATKTLTMAMAGSQRAVKALGIQVAPLTTEYDRLKEKFTSATSEGGKHITMSEKLALKTAKLEDKQRTAGLVIDTVKGKVRGQAEAFSKTAEGEMAVFSAKVDELQEKLGKKLLPKLTEVVSFLSRMVDKMERVDEWMGKIGANEGLLDILRKIANNDEVQKRLEAIRDLMKDIQKWTLKVVEALKDFKEWMDKIKGPSLLDVIGKGGDAKDPKFVPPGVGAGAGSISPDLYDELSGARRMGLTMTSGYRPGARTKHGTPSDHGVYPSKAIDVAGSAGNMARYFRWLVGQTDVKQAFYDPLGSIFGGILSSYREGGHSDHVHVATYDKGGWLMPGLTLAQNNTGRPEAVGFPGDINLFVDGTKLFTWFRSAEEKHRRRNG